MSVVIKLTGIAYHDLKDIEDCVVPKNVAYIVRENNEKASDGIAYRADCKGLCIGYVPELATLRKYYKEATSEDERIRIMSWGNAVKLCREQFKIDYDNNGTEQWKAVVSGLLYFNDRTGQWVEFDEYSGLCASGNASGFKLRQISVSVDGVEAF